MKKKIVIKIIGVAIIFTFAMFFLQAVIPLKVSAATSGLNWNNPNKTGSSPYKFKPQDVLNSQLIMQVVGCTGVVDKISNALTGLFQKKLTEKMKKITRDAIIQVCSTGKATAETVAANIQNMQYTNSLKDQIDCKAFNNVNTPDLQDQMIADAQKADAEQRTNECFNGIAITLAKNQLTSMTHSMMNWVNTGYGGNPFFVQNMQSLTNNIENNVLGTGIDILLSPGNQNPYAKSFAESAFTSRSITSSPSGLLGNLQSSLENFITDPKSYYSSAQLNSAQQTETALKRAQDANDAFANDFATGGWNGWLALTQIDQNNPLGFTMQASDELARQMAFETQNTKDELTQNNGFLSQKTCIKWVKYNIDGPIYLTKELKNMGVFETSPTKTSTYDQCASDGWKTITPGSLIKDKTTTYLNSPERQLELAKTINDALNALFSVLVSKLQGNGLSGLSDASAKTTFNWTDNTNTGTNNYFTSADGNSTYNNDSFDLTRDLGNIYIHDYTESSLGNWDASNNTTNDPIVDNLHLNIGVAPIAIKIINDVSTKVPLTNVFYTVSVAGNTKLINEGYNGWAVGDKAFWNGTEWQNWKKATPNPIAKRGVIQIQKDYVVAAKELLMNLPNIMPKIGELDYCIPGPNPNWQANSGDAYSNFSDFAYSLSSDYKAGSFLKRDSSTFTIAGPGQPQYENYKGIFDGRDPSVWASISPARWQDSVSYTWRELLRLGNLGSQARNAREAAITDEINNLLTNIGKKLSEFNKQYDTVINNIYGSNSLMLKPYIENEYTSAQDPNPAYLPMADTGLNITKDILSYNDDIATMTQDYKDSIVQANSNVYKLNKIKDEVSLIIQAAQKRRNDNMIRILNEEATRNGTPVMTEAQYNTKYASCLDEENITFYDDTDIMSGTGGEAGRCTDGVDNDLDGLIDMRDPDCSGITGASTASTTGAVIPTYYYPIRSCSDNQMYSTGPHLNGTYSSGARVQGGYGLFYVVAGGPQTSPISGAVANIMTNGTGASNCPL